MRTAWPFENATSPLRRLLPTFSSFSRASLPFSWIARVQLVTVLPASQPRLARLAQLYAEAAAAGRMTKFVPASGAASRMFQLPLSFFQQPELLSNQALARRAAEGDADCQTFQRFLSHLDQFAFSRDLQTVLHRDGHTLEGLLSQEQYYTLLTYLLTPTGLNYANLPKGLVPFHAYGDHSRTAFEEHLVEALEYVRDAAAIARLHFTVAASTSRPSRRILTACVTATPSRALTSTFRIPFRSPLQTRLPWTRTTSPSGIAVGPLFFVPADTAPY